mmetsp:Transcript_14977/g.20946  ORF Transcript_14977/g.20946 Transcript_14977/m.20946 type:complete len:253 (-) Transcript_14977:47-805(-)
MAQNKRSQKSSGSEGSGSSQITVESLKETGEFLILDTITKFEFSKDLMLYINSPQDVAYHRGFVMAIIELKRALVDIELHGVYYLEPPSLSPPSEPENSDTWKLFQFYKQMHYTFWEIKTKMCFLLNSIIQASSLERCLLVLQLIKGAKVAMDEVYAYVVSYMEQLQSEWDSAEHEQEDMMLDASIPLQIVTESKEPDARLLQERQDLVILSLELLEQRAKNVHRNILRQQYPEHEVEQILAQEWSKDANHT